MPANIQASLRSECTKFLSYDPPETAREALLRLAEYAEDVPMDQAGSGALIDKLESYLCQLLGKEAALFFPSGKAGQNILLRLWCESRGNDRVAMHPRCHIREWEGDAYAHLFGLTSVDLGRLDRQVNAEDVMELQEEVGVVTIELALRPLGCELMSLSDLDTIQNTCRDRGTPLHGDCARIWESQPHYGMPLQHIAGYFDSVYVSLYKGVGGLAGAAIAGPSELIERARIWQLRMGQKPYRQFPYLLAALQGLENRLPKMAAFHAKAIELATVLRSFQGVWTQPAQPSTNAFIVHFPFGNGRHLDARDHVAQRTGLWLFDHMPSGSPGLSAFEVHIWEGGLHVSAEELNRAMAMFLSKIETGH